MEKRFDVKPDTWFAIDGLGRMLPTAEQTGGPRKDKFVGLFYWTWHNGAPGVGATNVSETIRQHPDAVNDYKHPIWREKQGPYFWDEPIYGYYRTYNKWVLRKHAELLANAGVDVVIFDNTNGTLTWDESYMALAEVFSQARKDGVKAPQLSFLLPLHMGAGMANAQNCAVQLRHIYQDFYQKGLYPDMWFKWDGKPMVMGYTEAFDPNDPLDKEILDFFTFRPCQPDYVMGQVMPHQWGWLSLYPQKVYTADDGHPEQITVGVAQNRNAHTGLAAMNSTDSYGRNYTSRGFDNRPDAMLYGANFSEQWEYALNVDPDFVFVTGWNEWTAGRFKEWQGTENAFPDEYDDLRSRDCEPTKGPLKDHYYYQLCSFIRRFKGCESAPTAADACDLTYASTRDEWDACQNVYAHYANTTTHRDEVGCYHYTNDTGRNDILWTKVAHNKESISFTVACSDTLTSFKDSHWMRLFIRTAVNRPSWEGFQFVVNRINPTENTAYLETCLGGWKWKIEAEVPCSIDDNRFTVTIPRDLLRIDVPNFGIWFKWNDNMQDDGDIMDVYNNGDTAPGGRFMYEYRGK